MRHLNQAVSSLSTSAYTKLISKMTLTPTQMESMYRAAWEKGYYEKLPPLFEAPAVGRKFKFLGPLFDELVATNQHRLLSLPEFPATDDFEEVVKNIEKKTDGLIKRFGHMTRNHGVIFLNNMFFLRTVYPVETINVDLLLALDHTRAINPASGLLLKHMTLLQNNYPLKRYFELVTDPDRETYIVDTYHMLMEYPELTAELLKLELPKKPKSFREVHDAISAITMKLRKMNRFLDQDIFYLHGLKLFEYTIEVPSDSYELIDTSRQLKHCVHSYDQRVITKKCQIINLLFEGRRVYTIELKAIGKNYSIVQFKGYCNENSMEMPENKHYHEELFKLVSDFNPRSGS